MAERRPLSKTDKQLRHLFRKGHTYYVRVAVPKPLRPFFGGKDVILRSLQTGDLRIALERRDIQVGKIKAEFADLRSADGFVEGAGAGAQYTWSMNAAGTAGTFTAEEGARSRYAKLRMALSNEEDPARQAALKTELTALIEARRAALPLWRDDLTLRRGQFAPVLRPVAEDAELHGSIRKAELLLDTMDALGSDTSDIALPDMAAHLAKVDERERDRIEQEIPAAFLPKRAKPYLDRIRSAGRRDADYLTLRELIDRFFANPKRRNLDPETRNNYTASFRILTNTLGEETPLHRIARDHLLAVQDVIIKLPPRSGTTPRYAGMHFAGIAEAAEKERAEGKAVPYLRKGTRNNYLRNLGTLFAYAVTERKMDFNPAQDLTLTLPRDQKEEKKATFTDGELRAMFPRSYRLEGLNWLPVLMLYHGLRPDEAAQLDTDDIAEDDGVWVIDVKEDAEVTDQGELKKEKTLKTTFSARRIPLHQKVLDLGFLNYWRSRQQAGERKLFAIRRSPRFGYWEAIRKDFTAWLVAVGAKRPTATPHCLRHNWLTAIFPVASEATRRLLGGWTLGKEADVDIYLDRGRLDLKPLKAELDRVQFDILVDAPPPGRSHPGLIGFARSKSNG